MLKLQEVLLFEGLLKLPPVLDKEAKNATTSLLSAKLYTTLQQKIKKINTQLKEIVSFEKELPEKLFSLQKYLKEVEKRHDKGNRQKKEELYTSSFVFSIPTSTEPKNITLLKLNLNPISGGKKNRILSFLSFTGEAPVYEFYSLFSMEDLIQQVTERFKYENKKTTTALIKQKEEFSKELEKCSGLIAKDYEAGQKLIDHSSYLGELDFFDHTIDLTEDLFVGWYPREKEQIQKILKDPGYYKNKRLYFHYVFLKDGEKPTFLGRYTQGNSFYITINCPFFDSFEKLVKILPPVQETVEHEIGHFVQTALKISAKEVPVEKTTGRRFGHPSQKIASGKTDVSPEGNWVFPHGLRDIEFYPRLRDTKNYFERTINARFKDGIDKKTKLSLFKYFVGLPTSVLNINFIPIEDVWLKNLKKEAPLKWAKAVKELYKELFGTAK